MGYYVIAHDGNRYGPADIETLQQWVREGRIAPNTTLEDEYTGTQIRANLLPELSHLFPTAPPPPSGVVSQPPPMPRSAGTPSGEATAALIFGILGLICCPVFSIASLILGKQEMNRIDQGLSAVEGRGLAQAGYILGIVALAIWGILLALWIAGIGAVFRSIPQPSPMP
ncbi:MAG: DUF4190 domain-containing protein [bacterium]|nr:DUF4190 domain-containing protein [bacterium]MCS7310274.1 DUF4190 domain-containing protein [Armatimonadota bacterium]MDW8104889.1 DUF4190 domain-containing protein [Armatimonadota bacterium]